MQPGDLITRCPHCNTTFRITENQLEVAGGAVRCGSCLEIFAARNHLIEVGSPTESGTATLTLDDDQDLADHHEEGDLSADVNDPEDVIDSEADDPFFHEEDAYADDDTSRDALFSDDESDLDLDDVSFATQSDEIRTLDEISVLNLDTDHDEPDESDPNKRAELDDMRGFASEEDTEGDNVEDHEKFDEAQSDVGSPGEAATDDSSITDLEVEQDMSRDSLEPLEDESGQRQLFAADNADVQATKTPTESSLMPEADEPDWPQPDDEDPFDEPSDANDGLPSTGFDEPVRAVDDEDEHPDGFDAGPISALDDEEGSQDDEPEVVSGNEADAVDDQEVEGSFSEHLDHFLEAALEEDETDRRGQPSGDIASGSPSKTSGIEEDLEDRPVAPSGAPEEIDAALFAEQIKRALDEQPPDDPTEDVEERPLRDVAHASGWWWAAVVVLILFLPGQWLWSDRDAIAQDTVFRPVYVTLCGVVGCEVPAYNNPEQLTAGDLVVRQVPEKPGILHVDAIIRNDAGFHQPFPDLYIRFSSVRGDAVAARRFAPSEYLAGEMSGVRMIPPQTEVRISLSVVDPGDQALGYSLELIPDGVPLG